MKLLLLCLGLTLVCAQPQEGQDVVTCKLDLTKVELRECRTLDIGCGLGDSEAR